MSDSIVATRYKLGANFIAAEPSSNTDDQHTPLKGGATTEPRAPDGLFDRSLGERDARRHRRPMSALGTGRVRGRVATFARRSRWGNFAIAVSSRGGRGR